METELYKIRSVRSCFRAAYDLFCSNLNTIFKKTWLPMAVLSVITGLNSFFYPALLSNPTYEPQTTHQFVTSMVALCIIALLAICATVWASTSFISLVNGHTRKYNWPRVARATGVYLSVACVISIVTMLAFDIVLWATAARSGSQSTPPTTYLLAIRIISYIAWPLLLLPTVYSSIKYLMEPSQKVWSILGKSYRQGWHHWGFLFVCGLLCFIICGLAGCIVNLPFCIMWLAQWVDSLGTLMGDASGLPTFFGAGYYAVTVVCTFVWCYLMMWCTLVFYYAYGCIEAKIKEKTQTTL